MKILKSLGIGILALIIIALAASFFLPSKRHIERSIVINKSADVIFKQVNNLKTWKNWSYWDNIDPKMESTFEGPDEGVGAKHIWKSDHDQVGNGSMTITGNDAPNSLTTEFAFGEMTTTGGWTFENTDNGTKTTIYMDFEFPFYGRLFPGIMMDKWLGADFDKTLNNLKEWCEKLPDAPSADWTVEETTSPEVKVMHTTVTCTAAEIGPKMGEAYQNIQKAIGDQSLTQAGSKLCIFLKYSVDTVIMQPCIPIEGEGKPSGDILPATLPSANVAKLVYYGGYEGLEKAHEYLNKWFAENNRTISGAPWEEYVTDPDNEPDSTKWQTNIYYPVQ